MKKTKYQAPAMEVIALHTSQLLAGSTTEKTPLEFLNELQNNDDPLIVITDPASIL